ncbi:MAG: hypothetical protein AB1640_14945 [bacterium]
MDPRDEGIHDYPKDLETAWKENWYFNFIDRKNRAWGINHISLMRHTNQGRFTAIHVVDDEILPYSNLMDIENLRETADGKLRFEFPEPFKKFRVSFSGPWHQVEIEYEALFPAHDYGKSEEGREGGNRALSVRHYRQALRARGELTKDGRTRPIECVCDRDHTWGYRDEGLLTGWNWVGVYFPDRTINLHRILMGGRAFAAGYVSTARGNTPVVRLEVEGTRFVDGGPVSAVYTGYDRQGRVLAKVSSAMFSTLRMPMPRTDADRVMMLHENFAEFTDLRTGEKCEGIDEYLIHPDEPYHERPGEPARP